jgi:hypothetical protein
VVLAVLVALAVLGGVIYLIIPGSQAAPHGGSAAPTGRPVHAQAGSSGPRPPASSPAATGSPTPARSARPVTLRPARAVAFGPAGTGQSDNPQRASLAIDGNPATSWQTDWYTTSHFGNLQAGTGLLLDMGHRVTIATAQITLGSTRGADLQLRAGRSAVPSALRPVASAANAGGTVRLRLARPVHARYLLIWFTSLPPDPAGTYQAKVYNVRLRGIG